MWKAAVCSLDETTSIMTFGSSSLITLSSSSPILSLRCLGTEPTVIEVCSLLGEELGCILISLILASSRLIAV